MVELFAEIYRKQPLVTAVAVVHVILALVMLVGLAVDSRSILGLNPWLKPFKFSVSIAIYLFTIALFMSYLPLNEKWSVRVGGTIAITMLIEIILISMQAARGTTSHFNTTTTFDTAVFAVMGIAVAINTLMLVIVLWQYFVLQLELAPSYLWGIRLGLAIFIVASFQGFMMASRGAHTVGAADGGAGLPLVNWSTLHGDLRVAHFVGLHALQIIPLAGYLVSGGNDPGRSSSLSMIAVFGVAGLVAGAMGWMLLQALAGKPVYGLR